MDVAGFSALDRLVASSITGNPFGTAGTHPGNPAAVLA